jgi:hypothetical protein
VNGFSNTGGDQSDAILVRCDFFWYADAHDLILL